MKPGERIRLIQECAQSLLQRSWPEAQLILDQFGFETWEPRPDWDEFDPETYFIDQVKRGGDDHIAGLHEYLLGEDAGPASRPGIGPWTGTLPATVFLSHVHEHRAFIGEVKQILARRGIDAFVAHDDIHPSQQWREVIKAALSTCHAFVAFLHPGFHDSQWCDQEVGWALGRGIPVLTIRPEGAERRDDFLEEHQDFFMTGANATPWAVAEQIFEMFVRDPRTEAIGTRVIAEWFVNSGSFDTTRKLYALLDAKDAIEEAQLRRLEYAVQTNRQVYDAVFGPDGKRIPDLVAELVKRHEPPPPIPAYGDEEPF